MAIKNYTTSVAEERTVGEIMGMLATKGARSIKIDYDDLGRPCGVSFIVFVQGAPIPFQMPCNFEGVFRAMARDYQSASSRRRFENSQDAKDQSRRVAWRIIRDWIAAQMALIEAEQASLAQVFLPYAVMSNKEGAVSVFEQFMEQVNRQKVLTAGEGK